MRRGRKYLTVHFAVFGVLTALAQFPLVVLLALIWTFGTLGFLMMASATVLVYSAALLPAYVSSGLPGRRRWPAALAAILVPATIAIVPGATSLAEFRSYASRLTRNDVAARAPSRPQTIALIGDDISDPIRTGAGDARAPCGDVCRRLLFNGEVASVRVIRQSAGSEPRDSRSVADVTYRRERRLSCPEGSSDRFWRDEAFRNRIVAGDCLIASAESGPPPDVTVAISTLHHRQLLPEPSQPLIATIDRVRRLRIEQRDNPVPILQRTEIEGDTIALPFYFGYELHFQGGASGQRLGRAHRIVNPIELAPILREAFGFKVEPVAPLPSEDVRVLALRILALPASVTAFNAQQQEVIDDALKPMARQNTLSDGDLDLLKRVVADHRINLGQIGITLQTLFRRHADRMAPLIPAAIERLAVAVPENVGHYQNTLGWALMVYPAAALQPYRDRILSIVETQPNWPSAGLLARIAEFDGDPSPLIANRLEAKSHLVRQAAATAICRAAPENWVRLEPIALAHLRAERRPARPLDDENRRLLAALIRFGKKDTADRLLDAINPSNKEWNERWLAAAAKDFTLDKCR